MNTLIRSRDPGLLTLAVHYSLILLLAALLAVIWPLRAVIGWTAEGLIRVCDAVADTLAERLNQ